MMYHVPVMAQESIDLLSIQSEGIYIDLTYGGGGHAREILKKIDKGHLYAFDQDKDAFQNKIEDSRITYIHQNFRYLANFLRFYQIESVDGIFADLGVSSYQLDKPQKGFSYLHPSEKLDMRMNERSPITAAHILNTYSEKQLAELFFLYGDLPFSRKLAQRIVETHNRKKFSIIEDLLEIVNGFINPKNRYGIYSRVFQALRIEVNEEMDALKDMLQQSLEMLKVGGRLVVISYHSLEDRLVKNFMKSGNFKGEIEKDFYGNQTKPFRVLTSKPLIATKEEIEINSRARSAKLRGAEKI
jgi:16S rRNA (cytosine1402-N4)-methyltransferase